MHAGEIVGGANSIKFNSNFSSFDLSFSSTLIVNVYALSFATWTRLNLSPHAVNSEWKEKIEKYTILKKNIATRKYNIFVDVVWLPRLLIGSFNNHPKWQTIGWIKYTCWLNYHSNVFTPTNEHMAIGSKLFSLYAIVNRQCVCIVFFFLVGESANYLRKYQNSVSVFVWIVHIFNSDFDTKVSFFFDGLFRFVYENYVVYKRTWNQHQWNWLLWNSYHIVDCLIEEVGSTDGAFYFPIYVTVCVCKSMIFNIFFVQCYKFERFRIGYIAFQTTVASILYSQHFDVSTPEARIYSFRIDFKLEVNLFRIFTVNAMARGIIPLSRLTSYIKFTLTQLLNPIESLYTLTKMGKMLRKWEINGILFISVYSIPTFFVYLKQRSKIKIKWEYFYSSKTI